MGKIDQRWLAEEEQYFLKQYNLSIDPQSRLGSFIIELSIDDKPIQLSRLAKLRLSELEKHRKLLVKAQKFFRALKAHHG